MVPFSSEPLQRAAQNSPPEAAFPGSVLTVDLDAVRANYRLLQTTAATAECAAVVKADAYGLGAAVVAPILAGQGCRTFFVAHWAEAAALRPLLPPGAALFVLNGPPPGVEVEASMLAGVSPVLNSVEQAHGWAAAARKRSERLPAVLHVDTGLSRLGIPQDALPELLASGLLTFLELKLVMSHLACADEPEHPANLAQLLRFQAVCERFPGVPASLANSSGIFLGPEFRFDCVRAGAALYGINPLSHLPNPMQQAVRLSAQVIQVRDLPAGSGVGYGLEYVADRSLRTATVALGYGDGWPRNARTAAFFEGTRLPILGRVSMDSIVVDASALPAYAIGPSDWVELLGPLQTPDDLAAQAGTIGYEILTGIGIRPARRFVG